MIIHESPCMSIIIMNNVERYEIWRFLKSWEIPKSPWVSILKWSKLDDWKTSYGALHPCIHTWLSWPCNCCDNSNSTSISRPMDQVFYSESKEKMDTEIRNGNKYIYIYKWAHCLVINHLVFFREEFSSGTSFLGVKTLKVSKSLPEPPCTSTNSWAKNHLCLAHARRSCGDWWLLVSDPAVLLHQYRRKINQLNINIYYVSYVLWYIYHIHIYI